MVSLITHASRYTTADYIKRVILALQVRCRVDSSEGLFNSIDRAGLPISSTSQSSPLTSLSSLTIDREKRSTWSSPFLRLTSVRREPCVSRVTADRRIVLPVRILTDVVPRLELVESWTEDELLVVLHEAAHDLGIVQRTFMTVLRHALSGMKVWGTTLRTCGALTVLTGWTWGGGDDGCSRKRTEHCSPEESRDCILNRETIRMQALNIRPQCRAHGSTIHSYCTINRGL